MPLPCLPATAAPTGDEAATRTRPRPPQRIGAGRRRFTGLLATAAATGLLAAPALRAQSAWPSRPVRLVIPDLVTGQIAFLMDSIVSAQPHIRDGKVRALAVSGARRSSSLPNVPTKLYADEMQSWKTVIQRANIRPD